MFNLVAFISHKTVSMPLLMALLFPFKPYVQMKMGFLSLMQKLRENLSGAHIVGIGMILR